MKILSSLSIAAALSLASMTPGIVAASPSPLRDTPVARGAAAGATPVHLARRGADDRKGDDRGGKGRARGRDDGPRHG